jgi:superfamily I DNA and/or RNA helicase
MQKINQYNISELLYEVNERIQHWLCQNNEGVFFEVLTIKATKATTFTLERLFAYELKPLLNQSIEGVHKMKAIGFDVKEACYFVVYEYLESTVRLSNGRAWASIQSLLDIAKGLDVLKRKQYETQVVSPNSIRVNEEGNAVLSYIGLWDLFLEEDALPERQLSPNSLTFLKADEGEFVARPNYQDDLYALIKSFEPLLKKEKKQAVVLTILRRALLPQKDTKLKDYNELIELLEQVSFKAPQDETRRAIRIIVNRKSIDAGSLRLLLKEMNQEVCMDLANQRSDRGLITGRFSTTNWNGKFVLNNDKSLFIPHCNNERNDRVWTAVHSFVLKASFTEYPSNYNCIPFFTEKFEFQNDLSKLLRKQKSLVRTWRIFPEKELQQLEKNALEIAYKNRKKGANNSIVFTLSGTSSDTWRQVQELKKKTTYLLVKHQSVGKLLDYDRTQKTITLGSLNCLIDEIPNKGFLKQDIRLESSQLKKQLEACTKFEQSEVVNPLLCRILARPEVNAFPETKKLETEDYEAFRSSLFNRQLIDDKTQSEAVLEALHQKPVYLIQGPPGTGKTTVIVELLQQILKQEKGIKILVTSQSNLAVDNVLERLQKVNETTENSLPFMRLASQHTLNKSGISETIIPHTFENKLQEWLQETEQKSTNHLSTLSIEKQAELKAIQQDWLSFLGGVNTETAEGGKQSMLQNGHQEVDFLTAMLQDISIVGATCMHIASGQYNKVNFEFDYVIMDESSKASPPETLVPINMGRNIILIGDHKQLPPVITKDKNLKNKVEEALSDNGLGANKDFGKSLFETLIESFEKNPKQEEYIKMLDIQYRMPAQIGALISKYFYDNKLKNAAAAILKDKTHGLSLKKETSIVFINTSNRSNPSDNGNKTNRNNLCNVKAVAELLEQLNELYPNNLEQEKPLSIAVIAGYRGQVKLLRKEIDTSQFENFVSLIDIDTVDKFQGAERDIIIYDVVRSSERAQDVIGFLEDYRRINVAFSRVKRLLFVVGDKDYLLNRAVLHPQSDFKVFKLQQIVEELDQAGLVYDNFSELLQTDK